MGHSGSKADAEIDRLRAEVEQLKFSRGKVANLLVRAAEFCAGPRTADECRYVAAELRELNKEEENAMDRS
jgi:hypothetical protein